MNFTPEQLAQIGDYPKASIEYANKMITKDLHSGKSISNIFGYFMSICKSHAAKNKTPETGTSKPTARPTTGPMSIYKHEEREQESDYEFALNVERVLHDRMQNDETFHKGAARYPNPKIKFLTPEEQNEIMTLIHVDCSCRQNVDNSIGMPIPFKAEPVTESHKMKPNWDEVYKALKSVRDKTSQPEDPEALPYEEGKKMMEGLAGLSPECLGKYESHNNSPIMFDEPPIQDIGGYEDDYSDCE